MTIYAGVCCEIVTRSTEMVLIELPDGSRIWIPSDEVTQ
jgi:hypothetical protein